MPFPLLPLPLVAGTFILAFIAFVLSVGTEQEQPWFPWLLLPLVLLPHLLAALALEFAAMLSIYISWPAAMGPLVVIYDYLFRNYLGWNDLLFWFAAVGLAVLWLVLVRGLWLWRARAGYALWLLGFLYSAWLYYFWLLPPD